MDFNVNNSVMYRIPPTYVDKHNIEGYFHIGRSIILPWFTSKIENVTVNST